MKVKCEYCGGFLSDTAERCPNCGGVNAHLMRSAEGIPKTVAELQAFCKSRGMPLEKMRFFLGEDYKEPRAFGIYRDGNGDFIVYKNKADGTRAVRYRGKDEAYAVNELYQKLKSEVGKRKGGSRGAAASRTGGWSGRKKPGCWLGLLLLALVLAVGIYALAEAIRETPNSGYYEYNGVGYYNDSSAWYAYDATDGWTPAVAAEELIGHYGDYWQGYAYDADAETGDFSESGYAEDHSADDGADADSWNDDWDSGDWSTDYGSWDSGGTDWGSDW